MLLKELHAKQPIEKFEEPEIDWSDLKQIHTYIGGDASGTTLDDLKVLKNIGQVKLPITDENAEF